MLQVDIMLPRDFLRGKPRYGTRSQLIEKLLRDWLAGLASAPPASYNDDPETEEVGNERPDSSRPE